jgi:hypothetical protein
MPTWRIEYPNLLANDRTQLYAEWELIRNDPMLTNCEVTESQDHPVTLLTASFLGFGPENPAVAEIIRRRGIIQLPVNVWMPLVVSRLVPNSEGRYEVVRDNPPRFGRGNSRPDRVRGQTVDAMIIDDMASFEREFPLEPGSLVGVDPATGRLVPNSENPIGRVIRENLSLLSEPPINIVAGVDIAMGGDHSALTLARRRFPEDADRAFNQEFMGEPFPLRTELTVLEADPPSRRSIGFTVHERVGMGVVNPRSVERLQATRVNVPTFELQSNPQINLDDIRERRFDLIDRSVRSIQEQEDSQILSILEGTFTNQPPPSPIPEPVVIPEPVKETFIRRTRFERIIDDTDELYPL